MGTIFEVDESTGNVTITGSVNVNSNLIHNVTDPMSAQDAATKNYVDNIAVAGVEWKQAVRLATTSALPSNTYNNGASGVGATLTATTDGALSVDSTTVNTNDRILVKNEATSSHNGIYVVTQTGSVSTPYILTRSTDYDTPSDMAAGTVMAATAGASLADTIWIQTSVITTVGTSNVTFSQFGQTFPISVSSGGTGLSTLTTHAVLLGEGTSNVSFAGPGTTNFALVSNGTLLDPSFQAIVNSVAAGTGISVSGATGSVTISNTGVTNLTGTLHQVNVSASTGNITLSTPQNIDTTSSPTFAGLSLTGDQTITVNDSSTTEVLLSLTNQGTGQAVISFTADGVTNYIGTNTNGGFYMAVAEPIGVNSFLFYAGNILQLASAGVINLEPATNVQISNGNLLVTSGGVTANDFISNSANPATAGILRLATGDAIEWRNNANTGNISLSKNATDFLQYNGNTVLTTVGTGLTQTNNQVSLTTPVSIANGGTNNTSAYTAGSVIFSNGTSLTQDNAEFFWDNSNFRLGIGTPTPGYPLHIVNNNASTNPLLYVEQDGSGNSQIDIHSASGGDLLIGWDGTQFSLIGPGSQDIRFIGTNIFRIDAVNMDLVASTDMQLVSPSIEARTAGGYFTFDSNGGGSAAARWRNNSAPAGVATDSVVYCSSTTNTLLASNNNIGFYPIVVSSVKTVSTTYAVLSTDFTIGADATGGTFTVTLPSAVTNNGKIYNIKKIDSSANAITIATTSSQTIDGVTTQTLTVQNQNMMVQSNGSNWWVL